MKVTAESLSLQNYYCPARAWAEAAGLMRRLGYGVRHLGRCFETDRDPEERDMRHVREFLRERSVHRLRPYASPGLRPMIPPRHAVFAELHADAFPGGTLSEAGMRRLRILLEQLGYTVRRLPPEEEKRRTLVWPEVGEDDFLFLCEVLSRSRLNWMEKTV